MFESLIRLNFLIGVLVEMKSVFLVCDRFGVVMICGLGVRELFVVKR